MKIAESLTSYKEEKQYLAKQQTSKVLLTKSHEYSPLYFGE